MPRIGGASAGASTGAARGPRRAGGLSRGSVTGRPSRHQARPKRPHMIAPPGTLSRRIAGTAHPPTHWTLAYASVPVKRACRKGTVLSRPRRRVTRSAHHALVEGRALPRVGAGCGGSGWRRGLAHEPLERGDDCGGLLFGGGGRDDRELRPAVHGTAAAYRARRVRAP